MASPLPQSTQLSAGRSEVAVRTAVDRDYAALNGSFLALHHTCESRQNDVALLICPGLNRDGLDSLHSLVRLADEAARAGFSAARLELPGTANARDLGRDEEAWDVWLAGIRDAADWLRTHLGVRRVVLCGLRIGATMAALASAERDDVAGLILLAPVLRGLPYMRQLAVEARTKGGSAQDGLDFHELRLSRETVARISAVDLKDWTPGCPVAVFAQGPSRALSDCLAAWDAAGREVTRANFGPLAPMLRHDLAEEAPPPAELAAITAWLRAHVVPGRALQAPAALPAPAVLHHPGCDERMLAYGPEDRLWGVLCTPGSVAQAGLVVVIGNAGRDPSYGLARYAVELSRALARQGIASLRMDFAGLGESIGPGDAAGQQTRLFEVDRIGDVTAALDALAALGFTRFAGHGLCCAAYHMFHGALADPRLEALLLVNMPCFEWQSGDTISFALQKTYSPAHYLRQLASLQRWKPLLRREIDVRGVLVAQRARAAVRLRALGGRIAGRMGLNYGQSVARRGMAEMARRRLRILMLMSEGDDGLDAITAEFGPGGRDLQRFATVELAVVEGLDHTLTGRTMREAVIGRIVDFISA